MQKKVVHIACNGLKSASALLSEAKASKPNLAAYISAHTAYVVCVRFAVIEHVPVLVTRERLEIRRR